MAETLTTKQLFKTFASIDGTDQDKRIDQIIAAAHDAIERFCHRTFPLATYLQWMNGSGRAYLELDHAPILNLYRVSTMTRNALEVSYSGTATYIAVSCDGAKVTLTDVATDGTATHTDIAFTGQATITALATAISAETGWTGSVVGSYGNYPSAHLRPLMSSDMTESRKASLELPSETRDTLVADDSDYFIRAKTGVFPAGQRNVFVWFRAGYTMPSVSSLNTTPAALVNETNQIVKDIMDRSSQDGGMKSEKLGDYSYTVNESIVNKVIEAHAPGLTPFRRMAAA